MKKVRKKYFICVVLGLFVIISIWTNPTKQEYIHFSKKQSGISMLPQVQIERKNFYLFSTYASKVYGHHGIVHLGFMGRFFKISKGQYDYPWWLEVFN